MSTPRNLVIVESPAKAKTIEKFLGPDYKVMASYGHIRDLKKKSFSIDVEDGFRPIYEVPDDKQALVNELKRAASKAEMVWLASDEDREGEAIAWHLYDVLGLTPENSRRIVFHEITKNAILNAIAHPRTIDLARVDAQQARRVLDRIVGFELSPVLWKRLKPALSAGRVQSVDVRLIVERENEIRNFKSEPYYRVTAVFTPTSDPEHSVRAELSDRLATEADALKLLEECRKATFTVGDIEVHPSRKSPEAPFTTTTLLQEAGRKLSFPVSLTMSVAQRLYENGHITYMRTDSVNLSVEALTAIGHLVSEKLGPRYHHRRTFHTTAKGAQEAHEAIRPTYVDVEMPEGLSAQEAKLYTLIRRRAIASQMADAELSRTTVQIVSPDVPYTFTASDQTVVFDGFLRVYAASTDEDEEQPIAPNDSSALQSGMSMSYTTIEATERFTQQPPRYTETTLVKKMEELGIGRPATLAQTISTIQQRGYVERGENEGTPRDYKVITLNKDGISEVTNTMMTGSNKGRLVPTDTGIIVNDFLTEYFPNILDYNFTANIEQKFDEIAKGHMGWVHEIATFYEMFHPAVDEAMEIKQGSKFGERQLGIDPVSGRPVSVKIGRYGPVVQIGTADEEEKPQFASLLKNQSISTITLEEALKLFEFPRELGDFEDAPVRVAIGRFGPYVRHKDKFVSIPKDVAAASVTLEQAIELIKEKREADEKKVLRTYDEEADLQLLNGRYGPYIVYKKKNYKLPRGTENPESLSYDDVKKIIADADAAPAKPRRAAAAKKKK
ncbi:MAG: type I DNA topoisomerase [Muribaculaceae bacterium]|nr:type I DNA topoisomerase [Muribaculaceae bacterium]